jgi:hypothetical protein
MTRRNAAKAFVADWQERALSGTFDYFLRMARAGELNAATVDAIWQTRDELNQRRTAAATAAARSKKRKKPRGPGLNHRAKKISHKKI